MDSPLDLIDQRLIGLLQADARATVKSLAEQLGIASSTCLERIRNLQTRKVIQGFHAEVDLALIGRQLQAIVSVRIMPKSQELLERFFDHVWGLPETISVTLLSGTDDVQVHVAVADSEQLRRVVINDIANYPGVIDERTALVFEHRRKHKLAPVKSTPASMKQKA
jgi:DNA-binding Lrp family transcriptional regulator